MTEVRPACFVAPLHPMVSCSAIIMHGQYRNPLGELIVAWSEAYTFPCHVSMAFHMQGYMLSCMRPDRRMKQLTRALPASTTESCCSPPYLSHLSTMQGLAFSLAMAQGLSCSRPLQRAPKTACLHLTCTQMAAERAI